MIIELFFKSIDNDITWTAIDDGLNVSSDVVICLSENPNGYIYCRY